MLYSGLWWTGMTFAMVACKTNWRIDAERWSWHELGEATKDCWTLRQVAIQFFTRRSSLLHRVHCTIDGAWICRVVVGIRLILLTPMKCFELNASKLFARLETDEFQFGIDELDRSCTNESLWARKIKSHLGHEWRDENRTANDRRNLKTIVCIIIWQLVMWMSRLLTSELIAMWNWRNCWLKLGVDGWRILNIQRGSCFRVFWSSAMQSEVRS